MEQSKDAQIQTFLDGMRELDGVKYQILCDARKIVFAAAPDVTERFIYGGIMFSVGADDFGGVFASKKHVSFEYSQGAQFDDPDKMLEGGGKFRRHLKLCDVSDVTTKNVAGFVAQAINI